MKTTIYNHERSPAAQPSSGWFSRTALLGSALLLAAARLAAMPVVNTIGGGPSAGYVDGPTFTSALFNTPQGLAIDQTSSFLYVADRGNNAIRQLDLVGNQTISFATFGINAPVAVAVDASGNVFVLNHADGISGTVVEYDTFGDYLRVVASGLVNAQAMVLDQIGNLYVTVQGNTVLQIAPDGSQNPITTITAANTFLRGITIMDSGFLAVCDFNNNGIYSIDPTSGNFTALTGFNGAGDHFGTKPYVKFNQPYGIAAAGNGFLIVSDYGNNRVKVVDSVGTVTNLYGVNSAYWLTGPGTYPGWADGTVCRGDLFYNAFGCVESRLPVGIAFANDGTVYTTEDFYHLIRKVTASGLPQHPPPLPPVPAPSIGWVDYTLPPNVIVSVLQTAQPFVFNNDVVIAIQGTAGTETHYEAGPTPVGIDNILDPSATVGSTPPPYHDGMFPEQVPPSLVPPQPDITVKAIGVQAGRPSSLVVSARFQFKTANPVITGDNAALFTVSDQTTNAVMYYTKDGSDPDTNNPTTTIGPISSGTTLSIDASSDVVFKILAIRNNYQDSDIVSKTFLASSFVPNSMSFGFSSGEASSAFVAAPGQTFYAPVTLRVVPGSTMYSLQFNVTVTNAGPQPGPLLVNKAFGFVSMLQKPVPGATPVVFESIPPLMFSDYLLNPPPANEITNYDGMPFVNLMFEDSANNLLGVGWLERFNHTNLYDTTKQDLIKYSQAHDTQFLETGGKVVVGGYSFQVPKTAALGDTYQIQIGRPSATSDGVGAPGSSVILVAVTNGSLTAGSENAVKFVTAGQLSYIVGDCAPFRWFNAGDFGDTNLDNSDVMQVFQSAIYDNNPPPPGSDFFDSMDSCGFLYQNAGSYLIPSPTAANKNALFDGNDLTINQIAFGDGILDVCDVYVTFRRSLDPSLTLFKRYWQNGQLVAQFVSNPPGPQSTQPVPLGVQTPGAVAPAVKFVAGDFRASAGQTVQIPVTAQIAGSYPLRVLMLNLSVNPLDGSPVLTTPITFSPNPALGQPTLTSSTGNGNYGATWLNSSIAGLTSNAVLGTLTFTVPANASAMSAYAVHFDHASASPNGLGSFPKTTMTGLVTLADRSTSTFNDGIPDSWRLRYFGSVYNLLSQASADADGDGANNWQEYVAGTDPTDPKSVLQVATDQAAALQTQDCVVHWPSVSGKTYVIERSSALFAPTWIPVSTNSGTGTDMEFHDTTGGSVRFYRVQVVP